ncbi:MAG: hypothetical protein IKP58_13430 [Victivallales bacterium]|nr:hypothetical protein [Victivallales bacterium]
MIDSSLMTLTPISNFLLFASKIKTVLTIVFMLISAIAAIWEAIVVSPNLS